MYANETKSGFVKVYPNKAAIKQMALKSIRSAAPNDYDGQSTPITPAVCDASQGLSCSQPPQEKIARLSQEKTAHLSQAESAVSEDLYTVLLILLLLCSSPDSENSMFTLVLGSLFLS